MKKIHTEIFMGNTIDIFIEYIKKYNCDIYTVKINGAYLHSINSGKKSEEPSTYATKGRAIGGAKSSIKKNMSKNDEIVYIEKEIARLQAKLKELKNT